MNGKLHWWASGSLALIFAWACGSSSDEEPATCAEGSERCACYGNGTCDGALRCLSKVCVAPSGQPGGGGAAHAGSAGSEDEPDAGGSDSGGRGSTATGGAPKGGTSASGGIPHSAGTGGTSDVSGGEGGSTVAGADGSGGTQSAGDAGAGGSFEPGGAGGTRASDGGEPGGGAPPSTGGSPQAGAGGSNGTLLFSDDFDDGNADGWTATSWTVFVDGGNPVLRQNPQHTGSTTSAVAGSAAWADRRMEVRFKFAQQTPVSFAVLGTEFETADDRDQILVDISGAGTLLHASGGVVTTATFDTAITLGTWYRLALEISGTTLRGYFDGIPVAELENISGVRGGVALSGSQVGDVYYDEVLVTLP